MARLLDAVLPVELIHAAAGVNQLLLAGVEGVALGADFNGDVLLDGAGLDNGAALQDAAWFVSQPVLYCKTFCGRKTFLCLALTI